MRQPSPIRQDGTEVVLTETVPVMTDIDKVEDREVERRFWVPPGGGYVREVSEKKPGTLGNQVCARLSNRGPTLWATRDTLLDIIRAEYRTRQWMAARERDRRGY
jgi:hypothetical protein